MARFHYLIPWEWVIPEIENPFWRVPHEPLGAVDLRPMNAQRAWGGAPVGYALAVYDHPVIDPGVYYLGYDIEGNLTTPQKDRIRWALNLPGAPIRDKLLDTIWDLFTEHADPVGLMQPKPLMPSASNDLELYLGGYGLLHRERCRRSHRHWPKVLAVLHADYRELYSTCRASKASLHACGVDWGTARNNGLAWVQARRLAGPSVEAESDFQQWAPFAAMMHPGHFKKVLGGWMRKYGVDNHAIFIPAGLPDEGWQIPSTVVNESWNAGAGPIDDISFDLTWTEMVGGWIIQNNACRTNSAANSKLARCNSDLATTDQYAQCTHVDLNGLSASGMAVRKDSSATLTYYNVKIDVTTTPHTWHTNKVSDGAESEIGTFQSNLVNGDTGRCDISGPTIRALQNGVVLSTFTDTSITTGTRTGITSGSCNGCREFDAFEAGDYVAGGGGAAAGNRGGRAIIEMAQPRYWSMWKRAVNRRREKEG